VNTGLTILKAMIETSSRYSQMLKSPYDHCTLYNKALATVVLLSILSCRFIVTDA
jgi:hypothetical protein